VGVCRQRANGTSRWFDGQAARCQDGLGCRGLGRPERATSWHTHPATGHHPGPSPLLALPNPQAFHDPTKPQPSTHLHGGHIHLPVGHGNKVGQQLVCRGQGTAAQGREGGQQSKAICSSRGRVRRQSGGQRRQSCRQAHGAQHHPNPRYPTPPAHTPPTRLVLVDGEVALVLAHHHHQHLPAPGGAAPGVIDVSRSSSIFNISPS